MQSELGKIEAILVGKSVPFTRPGTYSGIDKSVVHGPVSVGFMGLLGDEQGDLRIHGGVGKAIHQYPAEHYPYWKAEFGKLPLLDNAGAFGENIYSRGMTETNICLGDRFRVGSLIVEVSQGRQPCWKLNDRFGITNMALKVQQTRRTGWYYRVIQEGSISAGDIFYLIDRPYPAWSIHRISEILYSKNINIPTLQSLADLPLPQSWCKLVRNRLANLCVEDWSTRLEGPNLDMNN